MLNKLRNFSIRNRHYIAVFILLNMACAVCIALVAARVAYSDSGSRTSLIWNLFLAFFLFLYITLYTFGHLLLSWQKNES